jgi:GT2 family glycosyltransferase
MEGAEAPLVSVIVPAWNAEATLAETLRSVAAQTYSNLEIVIVDDGSTDATAGIATRFCDKDGRARLVRKENGGVASARNRGIEESRGEWVAPIDADDLWHPTKIEKQITAALAAPEMPALVYCWFHYVDRSGRVIGSSARWVANGRAFEQMACHNFVGNGSAPLMRRAEVLAAGGYDEDLRAERAQGCEDLLLQLRIARHRPVAAVPEHLVGYRVHPTAMSRNADQMRRSWERVFDRLSRDGTQPSRQAVRWALGMRTLEFAEVNALSGNWPTAARLLVRALRLDPARCSLQLLYRLTRLSRRLVVGRTPRPTGRPFAQVKPTECFSLDPDAVVGFASFLDRIDRRRLTRLAASER